MIGGIRDELRAAGVATVTLEAWTEVGNGWGVGVSLDRDGRSCRVAAAEWA